MKKVSRRDFVRTSTLLAAALPALRPTQLSAQARSGAIPSSITSDGPPQLSWVDGTPPSTHAGLAFGCPWPMGQQPAGTTFQLQTESGESVPMQTWTTATWPDGSLKWTGHAVPPGTPITDAYRIRPGTPALPAQKIAISQDTNAVVVDTGVMRCTLPRSGEFLISRIERQSDARLVDGRLVGQRASTPESDAAIEDFTSQVKTLTVEQDGPLRAVVKIEGTHKTSGRRTWLPFSVRAYFHAGSESLRLTHTFIFDGDEKTDFIRALGVRFAVPMEDELYNRHIRFSGEGKGLWGEAVQGLTGLRRDPGEAVRRAQVAGERVPSIQTWSESVSTRVHWIPTWGDFSLSQLTANGFALRKRTKPGHAWVSADQGGRSNGLGYVGGVSGGVAFGMRDFWKLHPTQLDVRNAATETAEVTLWMWSPDAPPMDIRFYHDGLGQDIEGPLPGTEIEGIDVSVPDSPYAKQLDALNITYEDYEPDFGTPHGVGRSTDLYFWVCDHTPSRDTLAAYGEFVALPPQLTPRPADLHRAQVFSTMWALPDHSAPNLSQVEARLDWSIDYYSKQVEQRHWYGFWDYGDVMHTYDRDRHAWRYDVGGYAWDNSELSTDMWLWYTFLRTGDPRAYRLAEAMNRHNRDVDIYHLGRFKGLGTRHNVQHWGCSAKQLRISTCMNRRFHYFLTTDERTGDVLQEVVEADRQLANINPVRKLPGQPFKVEDSRIGVGTDWGAAVSNWLTAWERTSDARYRRWIENSMKAIGDAQWGFFTGAFAFDIETKAMTPPEDPRPGASHLSTMFGLPEVCAELIQLLDIPEFTKAWLQYCRLYNAPRETLDAILGSNYRDPGFVVSHSRITAYAAALENDSELAERAADELLTHEWGPKPELESTHLVGPDVLNPVDETTWVSTNDSAQWGLAAMQVCALATEAVKRHH